MKAICPNCGALNEPSDNNNESYICENCQRIVMPFEGGLEDGSNPTKPLMEPKKV
jgi:hypothetical protein